MYILARAMWPTSYVTGEGLDQLFDAVIRTRTISPTAFINTGDT